ncbi:MAG: hypothetical protein K2Q20_05805, partial [Phycisphaerales bacterium]|nr:hypothetical protein [Phycisphaerales bacterium]
WSPTNKTTTPSEVVTLNIPNTSSTQTVQFRFRDANSGWWALSQLQLTGVVGTACRADFNNSGQRDVADIFAFLSAWFANAPGSDFNNSGQRDVADIFSFLSAWFAGC